MSERRRHSPSVWRATFGLRANSPIEHEAPTNTKVSATPSCYRFCFALLICSCRWLLHLAAAVTSATGSSGSQYQAQRCYQRGGCFAAISFLSPPPGVGGAMRLTLERQAGHGH